MASDDGITIRVADWHMDRPALRHIRETVFVAEQGVPLAEEWDEHEATATHFFGEHQGRAVALRSAAGQRQDRPHGRVAPYRNRGLGGRLLDFIVDHALADGQLELYLHAQAHAVMFYRRHASRRTARSS